MPITCERCKNEMFKASKCDYCGRKICNNCIKSSERASKIVRLIICKSCWSNMPKRSAYKSNRGWQIEVTAQK
jgi:hypothetical protein